MDPALSETPRAAAATGYRLQSVPGSVENRNRAQIWLSSKNKGCCRCMGMAVGAGRSLFLRRPYLSYCAFGHHSNEAWCVCCSPKYVFV